MNKALQIVLGFVLCFILLVIMIVFAALYVSKYNCPDRHEVVTGTEPPKVVTGTKPPKVVTGTKQHKVVTGTKQPKVVTATDPTMIHFSAIKSDTTGATLLGTGTLLNAATTSYMKTIAYSQVPGKEMQGGVLRLKNGASLNYDQWFEGFVLILEGMFTISDNAEKSSALIGVPGDSFYIPRGTRVKFQATGVDSRLHYVIQPPGAEYAQQIDEAGRTRPNIQKKTNYKLLNMHLFYNDYDSLSYLQDTIISNIEGRELVGGFYKLLDGPALHYTYTYEEFMYIVEGEFHLKDSTGKEVVAKAGDLMYFPKGTAVEFTSPHRGLGFTVGQRNGGGAK